MVSSCHPLFAVSGPYPIVSVTNPADSRDKHVALVLPEPPSMRFSRSLRTNAHELLERGAINQAEFEQIKAKALADAH